jgi:hypothetical protein
MPNRKARRAAEFAERKRRMLIANESGSDPDKPHAQPNQYGAPENFCKWNSETAVRVLNQVSIQPPPNFLTQYEAGQKENETHNEKTRLIGWLTLVAVVIYAGLTAWLGCLTREISVSSQKQLDISRLQLRSFIQVIPPSIETLKPEGITKLDFPFSMAVSTGRCNTI